MPQSAKLAAAAAPGAEGLVEGINIFEVREKGLVIFWISRTVESLSIKISLVAKQGKPELNLETDCVLNP